jgi:alcohol dehydrogenase (cytochrome c)
VTQTQVPFGGMNEAARQSAPDVTRALTSARIRNARSEPQNWLTYYGAYDGQRYSTLDEITTANVRNLRPAWQFQFGAIGLVANPATYSFEAAR